MPPRARRFSSEFPGFLGLSFIPPKRNKDTGVLIYLLNAHRRAIQAATERRLEELRGAYGIRDCSANGWKALALAMAGDFIPAFRIRRPAGAPTKWGRLELAKLCAQVDRLRGDGLSVLAACSVIAKERKAPYTNGAILSADTLRRRYYQAKARMR